MKKKIVCLFLAAIISSTQIVSAFADRESDLRSAREATSSQLEATNSQIDALEAEKQALQAEIDQMDAELVDIMVAIDVLTDEISQKESEIEKTKAELADAEADRDQQYENMKLRIQYIYENGGGNGWAQLLLAENDLTSILNKAEYTQKLYDYDRESLEEYKAVVQKVKDLGDQLASEKADLEVMQNDYKEQQGTLESALEEKKATSADYENQIAVAQEQAAEYKALIEEQTAELQAIEIEKQRAAEEAARKAAEEEARRQAAAEAAAQAEEESSDDETDSDESEEYYEEDSSESESSDDEYYEEESSDDEEYYEEESSDDEDYYEESSDDEEYYEEESSDDEEYYEEESYEEDSSSDVSYSGRGQAVADYACQFVGNPYVWGGTSLTNGADCSGFIMSVYANFGVSLPHSSSAMRSCGVGVSYSEAQPGDIICYSGHVAIYLGGGSIVHASNERDGIKVSGNAAYRTILAVRRVI
ncbi:MAG: NlpC/P60 family protein [Ruminococcus sp.]|jgi:cell wall-associated NlpC family hydrolase